MMCSNPHHLLQEPSFSLAKLKESDVASRLPNACPNLYVQQQKKRNLFSTINSGRLHWFVFIYSKELRFHIRFIQQSQQYGQVIFSIEAPTEKFSSSHKRCLYSQCQTFSAPLLGTVFPHTISLRQRSGMSPKAHLPLKDANFRNAITSPQSCSPYNQKPLTTFSR